MEYIVWSACGRHYAATTLDGDTLIQARILGLAHCCYRHKLILHSTHFVRSTEYLYVVCAAAEQNAGA